MATGPRFYFLCLNKMKRITIRRTKKPTKPITPPQEPDASDATSDYSSSESLGESEPPTEQLRNLNVAGQPQQRRQVRFEPQAQPVRRTNVAHRQSFPAEPRRQNPYPQQKRPPSLNAPRSIQYPKPSRAHRGRRNLHFASHFGPNGHMLDTQTKTRLFLSTCFG
jgi:hypothetical protein